MVSYANNISEFVLNCLCTILSIVTLVISMIVVICIVYYHYSNRIKREEKIIFILCINIYFYIFFYNIIQLSFSIHTLFGDMYKINLNSLWCVFDGYFVAVLLSGLYFGFVVQVIINYLTFTSYKK